MVPDLDFTLVWTSGSLDETQICRMFRTRTTYGIILLVYWNVLGLKNKRQSCKYNYSILTTQSL